MNYKNYIIFFIILLFTFSIQLSAADTWVKTYRPFQQPYMDDKYWVEDVIVTQDSGYVVSGSFELYDDFYYENWGFLMKTDKDGNMLWASKDSVDFMSYNGYSVEFVETSDGDFLTVGFQGFTGDRYIMKRDSEGNCLWALPYGNEFGVFSMHNTQDGNIILAGRSDYNAALRKITEDGTTIWTKVIDCGTSIAQSVYECENGDFVLTGVDYDNYNILVIRTDYVGDSLWTRTFNGLGGHDIGNCIIETDEENIMVIGEIHSRSIDTFLGFYNQDGDIIWEEMLDEIAAGKTVLQSKDDNFIAYSYGGVSNKTNIYKFDSEKNIMWNREFDYYPANGDRCFQELENGSLICGGETHYNNDYFILTKTDSLGQVYSIDGPENQPNLISLDIYPNPIKDYCTISFNNHNISLKDPRITIYNIKGQKIRELEVENFKLGINEVMWDGNNSNGMKVASGIYFCVIKDGKNEVVRKMVMITSP